MTVIENRTDISEYIPSELPPVSGMSKMIGGFLFLLINFRVGGFDMLPDFIGYIFIFSGLNSLAGCDAFFEKARPFAVICCAVSILNFYQSDTSGTIEITRWTVALSCILLLISFLLLYYLIFGIRHVAQRQGREDFAQKGLRFWKLLLIVNSTVYPLSLIAGSAGKSDFLIFLAIPPLALQVIFLFFLNTAKKLLDWGETMDNENEAGGMLLAVSRKFFKRYLSVAVSIAVVLLTAGSVLFFRSWHNVPVSPADTAVSSDAKVSSVRDRMVKAGFLEEDVSDMPDEEVLRYQYLKSVKAETTTVDEDGGQCRYTSYYTSLSTSSGLYRMAIAYHWLKQPRSGYSDIVGIDFDVNTFCIPNDMQVVSYNLFEKQDKQGTLAAYQTKDIQAPGSGYKNISKRYRVYSGSDIKNQHGYFAFYINLSRPTGQNYFTAINFYIHQKSFLTLNTDPANHINDGYYNKDDFDFQYGYFMSSVECKP